MHIKKLGHCCLLIETGGLTILTDPGAFSVAQDSITGIDVVLITHEHADHLHIDSLKAVLANNPQAQVITNTGVGKLLADAGIAHSLLEGRDSIEVRGVHIEAHEAVHEEIFEDVSRVQNTGYFIADRLFYPGDSFHNPGKSVDILALPVAGPWCRIVDAIRYALTVAPRCVFPVHDGMLQPNRIGGAHKIPEKILSENGIEFVIIKDGEEREF